MGEGGRGYGKGFKTASYFALTLKLLKMFTIAVDPVFHGVYNIMSPAEQTESSDDKASRKAGKERRVYIFQTSCNINTQQHTSQMYAR